jgi:hypothetical protein
VTALTASVMVAFFAGVVFLVGADAALDKHLWQGAVVAVVAAGVVGLALLSINRLRVAPRPASGSLLATGMLLTALGSFFTFVWFLSAFWVGGLVGWAGFAFPVPGALLCAIALARRPG